MNPLYQKQTPLIAAILCATAWFAFWMRIPSSERPAAPPRPVRTPAIRLTTGCRHMRNLLNPVLFALPSDKGFSGIFPDRNVDVRLSLERPQSPAIFLERPAPIPATQPATEEAANAK